MRKLLVATVASAALLAGTVAGVGVGAAVAASARSTTPTMPAAGMDAMHAQMSGSMPSAVAAVCDQHHANVNQ